MIKNDEEVSDYLPKLGQEAGLRSVFLTEPVGEQSLYLIV